MIEETPKKVVRIALEGEAKAAHDQMMEQLKAQFVKLNSSKLVGWVVKRYFETGFTQDRQLIIDAHFDNKEYLKRALDNAASREDLEKALNDALQRVKGRGCEITEPKKRRGRKPKSALTEVPIIEEKAID